jgi:Holliday junction resolvase RusA-like endonuclease
VGDDVTHAFLASSISMHDTLGMTEVMFAVAGDPGPKGSPRVYTKDPRGRPLRAPRVRADSDKTEAWAEAVAWAAKTTMRGKKPFVDQALVLEVVFYVMRPRKHYRRKDATLKALAPLVPAVKPDGDKLQRTTQDAMQGIVFDEDSRIVDWHGSKRYSEQRAGAWIRVSLYDPRDDSYATSPVMMGGEYF